MTRDELDGWLRDPRRRCLVVGVLNVTPDSFSDGGADDSPDAAARRGVAMADDGADWIDVGGESTRPGSTPVDADEQVRRTAPVIRAMLGRRPDLIVSIDTTRWTVAEAALDAGAAIVNDVSAGRDDPAMLPGAARRAAAIVLMHMQGTPRTMQADPTYGDVVAEVAAFLRERVAAAESSGLAPHRVLVDPGIGFGKTTAHNLALLAGLDRLRSLGRAVLVGTSRKRFLGELTGEAEPRARAWGTAASVAWCVAQGVHSVRVHDARAMAQVVRVVEAIRAAGAD